MEIQRISATATLAKHFGERNKYVVQRLEVFSYVYIRKYVQVHFN